MTDSQAKLLARMERKAKHGGVAPTRRDLAKLVALVHEMNAQIVERDTNIVYTGSTARMVTTILERIAVGDPVKATVEDFGWEWGRGPDLGVLVRLVALREAVRAWKRARDESENEEVRAADDVLKALKRAGGGRKP